MIRTSIAITSAGALCSLGNDVPAIATALLSGERGLGPLSHLDLPYTDQSFGEVDLTNVALTLRALTLMKDAPLSRTALLAIAAAREAVKGSRNEHDTVVISASTVGGMDLSERHWTDWRTGDRRNAALAFEHPVGAHTNFVAHAIGSRAMRTTISTACSSSANAIILGAQLLRSGRARRVLAGGADALCRFTVEGFRALSAMDSGPTRPFDDARMGVNLGEAAAYLVLERTEDALHEGRMPLALLGGWANRNDAHHQTATSPDGNGPFAAMSDALTMAGVSPEEVDHINTHGTGTANNDPTELRAMERLFRIVPDFTSTKALTGHTLAAAGALEVVIAILCMQHGAVPVGHTTAAPMKGFRSLPVNSTIRRPVRNVLSSSFGFGGNDSALFLTRPES